MDYKMIKKGNYIKKEATIYLVKDFKKEGRMYILDFYFCSTKKTDGCLHINKFKRWYESELDRIKTSPSIEEVEAFRHKIKLLHPNFPIDKYPYQRGEKSVSCNEKLTEELCIEYLKDRGYTISRKSKNQ